MKISFQDQENRLAEYLQELKSSELSYEASTNLPVSTIRKHVPFPPPVCDLEKCNLDFLFRYHVFPSAILKFFGEWQLDSRAMKVQDVIVQQVQIPPISLSIKLRFGVRVLAVYRFSIKAGFSYGTLTGHPESGTNEFFFSVEDGSLFATVRTAAAPGLFLSRLLGPIFTKPYVAYCNAQALERMKDNFLKSNS